MITRRLATFGLLVGILPALASAQVVSATFSATFPADGPDVSTGDTFSGTATWNSSSGSTVALTTASLTGPGADGLSFASIPNANVILAEAVYNGSGMFQAIIISVQSTVDGSQYTFFFYPGMAANILNTGPPLAATSYMFTGPTPVGGGPPATPAPSSLLLMLCALGCAGLYQMRRLRSGRA
jgi:hypothetical protein